uniref:hypothetical protein n=1 Tax=Streptomyces olivaceus TaxID=47716 RepID=UPI0040566F8D
LGTSLALRVRVDLGDLVPEDVEVQAVSGAGCGLPGEGPGECAQVIQGGGQVLGEVGASAPVRHTSVSGSNSGWSANRTAAGTG